MTASAPHQFPNLNELRRLERDFQRGAYLASLVLESLANTGQQNARQTRRFDLPAYDQQFVGLSLGTLRTTRNYPAQIALRLPELPTGYFLVDGLLEKLTPTVGVKLPGNSSEGEDAYRLVLLYHCYVDYGISPKSVFDLQMQLNNSLFRQLMWAMDVPDGEIAIPPEPLRDHPEMFRLASMEMEREIANDPQRHVVRQMMSGEGVAIV